ncbi:MULTISPECIES: TRAP transporter large permease [Alcaligenes]|uniref:TRAP transporter large permease n=1 Tax=Alcaligenes TaxID=507 RepID=UPI00052C8B25|nr:TRAP transporter large permease [Alcaligenes faecalis]KGP02731.1 C4-dicarboxylate ABC transporter permease [Alcaligenes faecalis]UUO11130.1 TRAP transporter large permease [Alcaligenes faecalis]
MTVVVTGMIILIVLMVLEVPIAVAMALVGIGGFAYVVDWGPAAYMAAETSYRLVHNYNLSVIPLFILMGNLVTRADVSKDLFDLAYRFVGHRRGGLAIATVLSGGMFSAVCGSSFATTATMARVAYPSMKRYGYADSLAGGAIASAGTLGAMIPPSVPLIVYGVLTSNDIGKLFIAAVLPGILGMVLYIGAVMVATRMTPGLAGAGERSSWMERIRGLKSVGSVLLLFLLVIGGIYGNLFTPTEAAGIGAVGALLIMIWRRKFSWQSLMGALRETAMTSAAIFVIMVGAQIFTTFVNVAGFTALLSDAVQQWDLPGWGILLGIVVLYLVLGCMLEGMSMLLLTLPIVYPLIINQGLDPIWFGILVVTLIEVGLITPPLGMNVFVLNSVVPSMSLSTIYRGVIYFVFADLLRLALLIGIPGIALFLPSLM